jgi:two-component system, NtrC family, response regulator AtoC
MASILICDDDASIRELLALFLSKRGHVIREAACGEEAVECTKQYLPDVLILDLCMPGMSGFEVMQRVFHSFPKLPVVILTAHDDMASIVEATRLGVFDFIPKPFDLHVLEEVVNKAVACIGSRTTDDCIAVPTSEIPVDQYRLVGRSQHMRKIFQQIGKVADYPVTVLIQGDSGTGKELVARVIHQSSPNAREPFVAVNCGAVAEGLLESELFGHVRGSFTGAVCNKKGKFELAGKGTILLDEISETSPAMQVKLLRVLQEREFDPVGSERVLPFHARVIAVTNHCLEDLVAAKRFRRDLFYRLNVYSIHIPPLRQRRKDIEDLVLHYLCLFRQQYGITTNRISREAMRRLCSFGWPGNVRQLEHVLLNAVMRNSGDTLFEAALSLPDNDGEFRVTATEDQHLSLSQIEKRHIESVLHSVAWNKVEACRLLNISKPTLYSKIRLYGLHNGTGK